MFDDQNISKDSPPANLPFEPIDMLAATEDDSAGSLNAAPSEPNALSAGLLKPKTSTSFTPPPPTTMPLSYSTKPPVLGKILGVVIGVVVVGGVAIGGWSLYNRMVKNPTTDSLPVQTVPTTSIPTSPSVSTTPNTAPVSTSTSTSTPRLTGDLTDTDRDGLPDEEERYYGIDASKPDTDSDGLTDFNEIKVWGTDPLNPDTDADSYKDGEEVKNGYNPKGKGQLFNIPTSTPSSQVSVPASSVGATSSLVSTSTTTSAPVRPVATPPAPRL